MNYAEENYFGNSATARAKKTKTASRTARRVYALDAENQGRGRSTERQTKVSSCGDAADGFLKVSFLPRLQENKTLQAGQDISKMESDFYSSLDSLAEHYHILLMPTSHFEYPYNTALAVWDLEEKLKKSVGNLSELRLLQDSHRTYLLSEEKYSTGTTLYYIPIELIYQMLKDPKYKKNAHLLLSVCSYLCHSADVPYYRQQGSYLYWLYEMHRDWTEQDDDREENERYVREFDKAEFIGDCIEKKIFNRINLAVFEERLKGFKSRDGFDKQCLDTAKKAFALFNDYPNESIFRNAPINEEEEDETENESIGMEKYISFISNTKGWLYESIEESINNEFNEYGTMDEPTILKCFDGSELINTSLDFESRFFDLLDELCALLHNYKQNENE
ncbi:MULTISPECIES: hypothetical protein [unclassified Flavobacterium]|uniref:hypothetical protein n=1 Tax=unclassified Flavobacterium TaxID=196869 RepID=UPI0006ABBA37|nr:MULTISPECIES: hypothetical protein [unclassified Flavobacterium]KOP38889.1 hypothetical protein AKO67_07660 [Flavobacterium sp. VMW]OWU92840.1 hypothetical protein APR43_01925 [Flavobacterium sp. NLM]